jgi:hypothetical protein
VEGELPREQVAQADHRCRAGRGAGELAEHRRAGGATVETAGVGADHRPVHAAESSLVHAPEAVDDEVVPDVAPAVGLDVELVDAADQIVGLFGRVGVHVHRVVDDRVAHRRRVLRVRLAVRCGVADALVGPPLAAGDEPRGAGRRGGGRRRPALGIGGGVDLVQTQAAERAFGDPHLDAIDTIARPRRAGSGRVPELRTVGVGSFVGVPVQRGPRAPRAVLVDADVDRAFLLALPLHGHELCRDRRHHCPVPTGGGEGAGGHEAQCPQGDLRSRGSGNGQAGGQQGEGDSHDEESEHAAAGPPCAKPHPGILRTRSHRPARARPVERCLHDWLVTAYVRHRERRAPA